MTAHCPPEEQLERLLDDRLETAEDSALGRHVESCAECQARLERLLRKDEVGRMKDEKSKGSSDSSFILHPSSLAPETADALLIRLKKRGRRGDETLEFLGKQPLADRPSHGAAALPEVPGYEVLSEIGRGGMGVIYKARHLRLGRVVALKMILAGAHAGSAELRRFHIEASAVARLAHPGIVGVYDVGEHEGLPYLSLELVEGGSLKQLLAGIPQPPRASAQLVEQLARAVQHAHDAGIVHRDLKPGNVLLQRMHHRDTEDTEKTKRQKSESKKDNSSPLSSSVSSVPLWCNLLPKITDFGLAKLLTEGPSDGPTQSGAVVGTPGYMAPEQAAGNQRQVGPAVDVYALGAILYECLTGRPPFQAATPLETLLQVMHHEPVSISSLQPRVPRDLATIAMRCLEKTPARRYARALDLAEDLRRFQAQEPILARPPSSWYRATQFVRRHKALVAAAAGIVAAMLIGTIVSVLFALGEYRQRQLADSNAQRMEEARRRADDNAQRMEEARRQALWEAYQGRTAVAQFRMLEHSPREAAEQLDKAPADLRRWEWFHLHSRLDDSMAVIGEPTNAFAALFPTSGHVVLSSPDQQLSLWDADNTCLKQLTAGRVLAAVSSPARSLLVVEPRDGGDLIGFDDSGRPGPSFHVPGPDSCFSAALSTDGKQLALAWTNINRDTHTLALFDPATGALSGTLPEPQRGEIVALAFSADGTRLVAGMWGGYLELWDVPAHRLLAGWQTNGISGSVSFKPDGGQILSIADGRCSLWEVPTGQQLEIRRGAEDRVAAAAYSPDGRWIATGGKAGVLRIFERRVRRGCGRVSRPQRCHPDRGL